MAEQTPAALVADVMTRIRDAVGVDAQVNVVDDPEAIKAEFVGDDLAALIGRHGNTLDSIQQLAHRIAFRGSEDRKPVSVDAGGYRERRAEGLRAVADQAAETAIREGRRVPLDPMGAQERKVVHEHLKGRFDIETYSEGQEPSRRLVVAPLID